ncbi:uncharacterized protein J4E84_000780 [Alternaria hordeiaustralica]|uniref:uncharacterized protein n=2 Tax=Alternaria sect. Infectoriae TaxID=2499258 RepID=UPI0020C1F2DA|nr:uncharacterized protein J4E84_000780 [Alternaria hordeiaustralica]KAI4697648.1 hypothetical protein J4E84_000780 [Alternaria hordeiaustralica]
MTTRGLRSVFKATALLAVVFLLIAGFGFFDYGDSLSRIKPIVTGIVKPTPAETKPSNLDDSPTTSQTPEPPNASGGSGLSESNNATVIDIPAYLHAIMNPASTTFPRLECPQPNLESMQLLGIRYYFKSSDINPLAKGENRIENLAKLRNLALRDLIAHPEHYDEDTTVIFSNDVALCMEDILEIIHQRKFQGADQTCAMDWTYVGDNPTYYDVWIGRGMTGDLFFNIPEDGSWDNAWNLFYNDPKSQARWSTSKPFQVFSCWNGITAFTAKPLMEKKIKFRTHKEGECFQGEPKLFAKDMWFNGYGKIAVVPSVNVEYSDEGTKKLRALKGSTSKHVADEGDDIKIEWEVSPPEKVKCMPDYRHQTFVAWDEGLRR